LLLADVDGLLLHRFFGGILPLRIDRVWLGARVD